MPAPPSSVVLELLSAIEQLPAWLQAVLLGLTAVILAMRTVVRTIGEWRITRTVSQRISSERGALEALRIVRLRSSRRRR